MAQVGNLLNRTVTANIAAADQTAGTAWVAVNLQTPGDKATYLSGLDGLVRLSLPAETATITNIRAQILQGINLLPNVDINVQLQQGILLWFADTFQPTDRLLSTRFLTPWELDKDTRYTIVMFPIFSAALASIDAIDLTVLGLYDVSRQSQQNLYGKPR